MSAPPKTVLAVGPDEQADIRNAVREADVSDLGGGCTLAETRHVKDLVALLADPAVSGPIYDLPQPIDETTISIWVAEAARGRRQGECVLTVTPDEHGRIFTYSRFTIWPELSAAEIAGAYRSDRQSTGAGRAGAARSFDWMFRALRVRLICVTAALDNIRSARVIEAAGFRAMGERLSTRADGTSRRSLYWELTREKWLGQRG